MSDASDSSSRGRRALVTGAGGFVGRWLVRTLVERGVEVTGAALSAPPSDTILGDAHDVVRWVRGDVRDPAHIAEALDIARPDDVYHLAGVTFVPAAGNDPGATTEVNVVAAARLLSALRERKRAGTLDPAIVITGSAEQYGRHDDAEMPLAESAAQRPHTVYAATKVAQEAFALQAARADGLRVVVTRSFNHSGPGQAPHFLIPALVTRALKLRGVADSALSMGNQTTVRDFLHVSDVVAAYIALAARGRPGEAYNVASGQGVSVGDLARRVLARAGVDARIESDPALVRLAEVPALVGDASKLRAETGWAPARTLNDLLDDLILHHGSHSNASPH